MLDLSGKTAIVTGASRGIGRAIAASLAGCGAFVYAGARDTNAAETVAAIRGAGGSADLVTLDVTDQASVDRMVAGVLEQHGRIDILVNNAGAAPGGTLDFLTEEHWAAALQLKFMGYVRCTRHALPYMIQQGGGRVVNLIGNDGVKPSYWEIAPGAANAAGQNLTLALAAQYGRYNISFCAVNPGPVRTERWTGLVQAMARDMQLAVEAADQLAPRSIPLGRIAEVDEVADLVVYLCSPRAHFVNGTMIEIDGGQHKALMDRGRDRV
jgi:NAD(P)-dependent dehydrogenase (short-subunit alcohol dehydrogenase family)